MWQHLSRLKASAFFSLQKKISCYETQQLILGTGTAIWWVTEPHFILPFLTYECETEYTEYSKETNKSFFISQITSRLNNDRSNICEFDRKHASPIPVL